MSVLSPEDNDVYAPSGNHDDLGVDPEQAASETSDLEDLYNSSSDDGPEDGEGFSSADELRGLESGTDDDSETDDDSSADEKLGLGFTGSGRPGARKGTSSRRAKRTAKIIGTVLGSFGLTGTVAFFSLVPSRLQTTLSIINDPMSALNQESLDIAIDSMFSAYVKYGAVPALDMGQCNRTVTPGCVKSDAKTPIGLAINAMSKSRKDNWLAKQGIVIGKRGRDVYMKIDNKSIDISGLRKDSANLFELPGMNHTNRAELRRTINAKLKKGTLYDKTFRRFFMNHYLVTHYGARYCVGSTAGWCKPSKAYAELKMKAKNYKQLAKATVLKHTIPEKYNVILFCIMDVNSCNDVLNPAERGQDVRRSPAQQQMSEVIQRASSQFSQETLDGLLRYSNDVADRGITSVFMREAVRIFITRVAGEAAAQTATVAIEKASSPVGWILMAIQAIQTADKAGPTLRHITYAANIASAIELLSTYEAMNDQSKNGRMDAAALGSFNDSLATNLTGSTEDQHDATQSGLYDTLSGDYDNKTSSASLINAIFPSTYAAVASGDGGGNYKCGDSKPPKSGQACDDAKPDQGNGLLDGIHNLANTVPGMTAVANTIGPLVSKAENLVSDKLNDACMAVFFCAAGLNKLASVTGGVAEYGLKKIIPVIVKSPFTANMSGARTFDILAVGSAASASASTRDILGGQSVTPAQAISMRASLAQEKQLEFEQQSLLARVFSKENPRSVVSHIAMSTPARDQVAQTTLASLLSNPLATLADSLDSLTTQSSYAAPAISTQTAVGVMDVSVMDMPTDAEAYFQANCMSRYDAATNTLDSSDWQNDPANVRMNPESGEPENLKTDYCRTIHAGASILGGSFDAAMLPKDALSEEDDSTENPGTSFIIGTYNQKNNLSDADHQTAVNNIVNEQMDVVGTQETGWNKYSYYKTALAKENYGIWPETNYNSNIQLCTRDFAIVYNKAKFKLTKHDYVSFPQYPQAAVNDCGNGEQASAGNANAPIVWLQDISKGDDGTGQTVIIMNTHNLANVAMAQGVDAPKRRNQAAQIYVEKIQELKKANPDIPIFFTGDFNEGTGVRTSGNLTLGQPDPSAYKNLLFCMFAENKLMVSADGPAMKCEKGNGAGGVDYIYTTPEVQVDWSKRIEKQSVSASDHPVVYAKVTVSGSTGAPSGSINVASFNICHSLAGDKKCGPTWKQRLAKSTLVIQNNHLDVVGLQEARQDQQQYITTDDYLGDAYSIYPTKKDEFSPNAVVYRNSTFVFKSGRLRKIEYSSGKTVDDLVEVHLITKKTDKVAAGGEVIFISTHDPANIRCSKPGTPVAVCEQSRKDNAGKYVELVDTLHKENPGVPIFLVGDFNSPYVNKPDWPSCIVEQSPVIDDAWFIYKRPGKTNNNDWTMCLDKRPMGSQVDRIYASQDVKVSNYWIAQSGITNNGSDRHDTIMATVQFAGAKESPATSTESSSTISALRNYRDASTTSGGSILKQKELYRSDQLNHLTAKGNTALSGILTTKGTVIDVRTRAQRAADPDPKIEGVHNTWIPIDGLRDQKEMVTDPVRRKQLATVLRTAASAKGPVLIHCMSGKDRTGWLVAMIMYINGANDSQVMDEYMKSNEAVNNGHVEKAWLNSGLTAARNKHGSIDKYLRASDGLNLSNDDINKIKLKFGAKYAAI